MFECTCLYACSNCCVSVCGRLKDSLIFPIKISAPLACWLTCFRGGPSSHTWFGLAGQWGWTLPSYLQVKYRVCKQYRTVIWPWHPSLYSGWCLHWLLAWIGERMRSGVGSVHAEGTFSIKAMICYDWCPTISHLIFTPTRLLFNGYAILVLEKM